MKQMDGVMDESSIVYIAIVKIPYIPAGKAFQPLEYTLLWETLKACVKDTSSDILDASKREAYQHSLHKTLECPKDIPRYET